jgi:hypothetical protein
VIYHIIDGLNRRSLLSGRRRDARVMMRRDARPGCRRTRTTPYLPAFAVAPFSKVPFGVYVGARVLKLIADIARDEIAASMVAARNSSAGSRSSTSPPHVSSCHLALASPTSMTSYRTQRLGKRCGAGARAAGSWPAP